MARTHTKQRNPLMKYLHFDAQDMTYNRKGVMSPRQQRRFIRCWRGRALFTAALGGVIAALIGQAGGNLSAINFLLAQILNAVFFGWLTWSLHMDLFKDAVGGHVEQVSGKPTLQVFRNGHRLCIGNMAFPVSNAILDELNPNTSYCAYFAPNSNRLLALELKRQPNSKPSNMGMSKSKRTTQSTRIPAPPPPAPTRRTSSTPSFGSRANQEPQWY